MWTALDSVYTAGPLQEHCSAQAADSDPHIPSIDPLSRTIPFLSRSHFATPPSHLYPPTYNPSHIPPPDNTTPSNNSNVTLIKQPQHLKNYPKPHQFKIPPVKNLRKPQKNPLDPQSIISVNYQKYVFCL